MKWLKDMWSSIAGVLGAVAHFVFNAFTHYDTIADDVQHIVTTVQAAKLNIEREVLEVKKFKFDPRWKTRVINVPIAAQQILDLKALLLDDFKNRLQTITEPVHELSLILKTEASPNVGDPSGAAGALAKTEVKLGHVVTMIHQVRQSLDEITNFIDIFRTLRENFEGLDALFLQQGNPKIVVDEHYRKRQRQA